MLGKKGQNDGIIDSNSCKRGSKVDFKRANEKASLITKRGVNDG